MFNIFNLFKFLQKIQFKNYDLYLNNKTKNVIKYINKLNKILSYIFSIYLTLELSIKKLIGLKINIRFMENRLKDKLDI